MRWHLQSLPLLFSLSRLSRWVELLSLRPDLSSEFNLTFPSPRSTFTTAVPNMHIKRHLWTIPYLSPTQIYSSSRPVCFHEWYQLISFLAIFLFLHWTFTLAGQFILLIIHFCKMLHEFTTERQEATQLHCFVQWPMPTDFERSDVIGY